MEMTTIEWINDIINGIPRIMDSIMYGYIFLFVYRWISFKDKSDQRYTLIVSIILNYLLVSGYSWIALHKQFSFLLAHRMIYCILIAFILGILFGLIVRSDSYAEILRDLHIARDSVDNIWDSAIKNGTWLRIYTKDPNISYLGYVIKSEPFRRNPHIILGGYQILDINDEVLANYQENENEQVILSTENFDRVEITYTAKSVSYYSRLKNLIHSIRKWVKNLFSP